MPHIPKEEVAMKRSFKPSPFLAPMPVLMIATYGPDGTVDVMNMAWGGICGTDKVALNITETHRTVANIKERRAFTIAVADVAHVQEADFFGIATGNRMADKFERSGLTAARSEHVDAPVIEEFPLTLECEVLEAGESVSGYRVVGRIVNVSVDEKVLDEKGKVDPAKLNAFAFDQFQNGYYKIGEKVGQAWKAGAGLMRK